VYVVLFILYTLGQKKDIKVKRWLRGAAAVRIDMHRDPCTSVIANHPFMVIGLTLFICVLCVMFIFIPVEHDINFDISMDQFRVEGMSVCV